MSDISLVSRLVEALSKLAEEAGKQETTRVIPNATVVDAAPSDLPSDYVIVENDLGYYTPAVKVPGILYNTGDKVNVLLIKGTEPIAFMQGAGSPSGAAIKNNLTATTDPTINDDAADGYSISSIWVNTTSDEIFMAADVTVGAAVWESLTAGSGGGAWPGSGKIMVGTTEYASIAAVIAAGFPAGTVVKFGEGDFTLAGDLAGLVLVGMGYDVTNLINSTTSPGASVSQGTARFFNLTIKNEYGGGGSPVHALLAGASGNAELWFWNCDIWQSDGSAPATSAALKGSAAHVVTVFAYLTDFSSAAGLALDQENAGDYWWLQSCGIYGTAADIDAVGTVDTLNCNMATGVVTGAGTVNGPALVSNDIRQYGDILLSGSSRAIKGVGSNTPDLGSTTAAEQWGNIYLASAKDMFPYNDKWGMWSRQINFGRNPTEHWRQGADEISWTGWGAYAGFVSPPAYASYSLSKLLVASSVANRGAFRYRPYVNNQTTLFVRASAAWQSQAGVMVDNGVDGGDNYGATGFIRFFVEYPTATANANLRVEYRSSAVAPTTATYLSFIPQDFITFGITYGIGTRWTNWTAIIFIIGNNGVQTSIAGIGPFAWTPARHGLYGYFYTNNANRVAIYDSFEEV